jgi:hypothetical protein
MAEFHKPYIYINDRTVLHMSFIETVGFPDDSSDIVDKLKGDLTIEVTTLGGRNYTISMLLQRELSYSTADGPSDLDKLRKMIYRKWLHINRTS